MFKKNELRPGNYIQGPPFSHPRMGIWGDGTSSLTYYGLHEYGETVNSKYTPIPLTVEWLTKLGFRCINKYAYAKRSFFVHNRVKTGFNMGKKHPIKYVHQLQNLYFYLAGEELTYL